MTKIQTAWKSGVEHGEIGIPGVHQKVYSNVISLKCDKH